MGLSSLLGALGSVSILFALASFFMALSRVIPLTWSIVHGVVGLVLLGAAAVINLDALRERMHSGEARRASKYGSSAVLSTILAVAILGMGGYLATRYPKRFDWSEAQVHSLSDQTQKVLAGLDGKIEVVGLFSRVDSDPVRELLDRYEYVSDRFEVVEFADPNEKPDLLERYSITPEQLGSGLVRLAYGDESVMVDEVTEPNLTNAMVKLTRTGGKRVYFLEGHNERPIDGEDGTNENGISRAAEALRNENYDVEKLLLATQGAVPEDADVVIIAGATRPLHPQESEALERFVAGGGAVLAMIDPRAQTDLVGKLAAWGVELGDDLILDRQLALFGRAATPFASHYDTSHAITKDLREPTLFHVVRSVSASEAVKAAFAEIVLTGEDSWAERDLERFFDTGEAELGDEDRVGPVPIAVAGTVTLEDSEARLAVYGDADFVTNELLGAYRNRDLFVNTVNWLLGDVESISVRPNTSRASDFQLSTEQFQNIRLFALFVIPEALAVLGVFTWWTRRQPSRA